MSEQDTRLIPSVEEELLCTSFGVDEENLLPLVENAKDYAISKGIAMRVPDLPYDARVPISFCLVPSHFPEKWFLFAKSIQTEINYVIHKVAHSRDFLKSCLASTVEADEFTAQIWKIYETVEDEGVAQDISLGLLRSDYMLDTDDEGQITGIKQVENNTIACSFGGVSSYLRDLHMFVLDRLGMKDLYTKLPENEVVLDLAKGIVTAWDAYGKQSAIILFVVEDVTFNICDQRALEYAIWEMESDIQVLRHTFAELHNLAILKNQCLFVNGKEVAIVYYRCGYIPSQYQPEDWEIRLMIERSLAIKCPTTGYQLAGTKKVQMQLTCPGVLEQFLQRENSAALIRQVFAAQYALDMGEEGDKAVALGIENPHSYVMKPEREGGGNNIYGDDVKTILESIGSTEERQAYILMEKLNPPPIPNCVVTRNVAPKVSNVVCELGIFGVIMGKKDAVYQNYEAGHLLRSKEIGSTEGGIAAGFGALDSPYLT